MFAEHVVRGTKAGLVAGLVFGLFVALVANPLVAAADGQAHAHGHHEGAEADAHEESAVSATVTNVVSVASSVLWGLLLGAVGFGVVGYFVEPIVPGAGPVRSYLLAVGGFLTVSGGPWLLLPPTVPGGQRAVATETGMVLYAGMAIASALACLAAAVSYDRLRDRHGRRAAITVALVPLAALATVPFLSPLDPTTGLMSPDLAGAVLGTVVFGQVLLWLTLAATHARLEPTAEEPAQVQPSPTEPPVSAD